MNTPMKYPFLMLFFLVTRIAAAQEQVEMADSMRANGKIYVIVAIVLIVLFGMIAYLFLLDRKISRLENEMNSKPNGRN